MTRKFGKLAPKWNRKTLRLSDYIPGGLPAAPEKVFREYKIPPAAWGMMRNDQIGDCTCAAIAHMVMLFTAHTGALITPTDDQVVGVYSAVTGYDPAQTDDQGNNPTDQGAAITDILNYWQTTGIAGHKILGWAKIALTAAAVREAMYLFGAVDIGFNVPQSALDQTDAGQAWAVVADDGGIQGGHSVPLFGYGDAGFDCTTWGANQKLTTGFAAAYMDEAYVVLTDDWLNATSGLAPNMLDLAALEADLAAVRA
jgi:hypothetical protein